MVNIQHWLHTRRQIHAQSLITQGSTRGGGWQDTDDDVRAVAAEALLPVAGLLAELEHDSLVQQLRARLWDILLDVDDLSPSTGTHGSPL